MNSSGWQVIMLHYDVTPLVFKYLLAGTGCCVYFISIYNTSASFIYLDTKLSRLEKQRYQRSDLCSYCWEANDLILVSLCSPFVWGGDAGIDTNIRAPAHFFCLVTMQWGSGRWQLLHCYCVWTWFYQSKTLYQDMSVCHPAHDKWQSCLPLSAVTITQTRVKHWVKSRLRSNIIVKYNLIIPTIKHVRGGKTY